MPRFVFALPDRSHTIALLLDCVSDDWSWVDGHLQAPASMVASGEAIKNIQFSLRRSAVHGFELGSNGRDREGQEIGPDLYALLVERKRPMAIAFDEAGYMQSGGLTLSVMKRIAIAYVELGYRGQLEFFSGCRNNNKHDNPARCALWMMNGEWSVLLAYNEQHGGKAEDIKGLHEACVGLGLRLTGSCA